MVEVCGPKNSRRYLILVNIVTALFAIVFLIVGGVSLSYGESFRRLLNNYCREECTNQGCSTLACSESIPACDCTSTSSTVPTYFFTAPAAGLISVGVFSLLCSLLGCYASIRIKAAWLCAYICFVGFVLLLQFSFGVAAATITNVERVPDAMQTIFEKEHKQIDWLYFRDFFPEACYAKETAYPHQDEPMHHPACFWNATCDRAFPECCDSKGFCNWSSQCTSPASCISGFLASVGTPVAVVALLTLVLEFAAIGFACIIRRETRAGGVFDPKSSQL